MLVLVALASVVVLSVLGPSIGITFHNAADDASNPEVRAIQQRQTEIALGTETFAPVPTSAYTAVPPTSTYTAVPPGPTLTNTPVVPVPTNTFTSVPPTSTNTATATPTATATATATNTLIVPTATPDWILCATENGTCSFSGTKEVRYGEAGFYVYLIFTNGTPCTNAVFGDPIVGTTKHCYYRSTTLVPTATATSTFTPSPTATATATNTPVPPTATPDWIYCADQGGTCSFSGTKEVRYGHSGTYVYLILTNGTPCTNAVFGNPITGTKQCYYRDTTLVPTPSNSIISFSAVRRSSGTSNNKNKVDVSIILAHRGSLVTITDTQAGEVVTLQNCNSTGTPTCAIVVTLLGSQSAAGTMTVSGPDFGGQTMSDDYLAKQ